MDSYNIQINGLAKLIAKLEAATKDIVIKESLDLGGLLLAGWSKKNRLTGPRPRFLGVRTGRLRSSISTSGTSKIGNAYINMVGTNVVYAPVHEFGSIKKNIPARPFLRPSLEDKQNQKEILNILTRKVNEALNK